MAVQQEMAVVYPPDAEELCEFLPETDCGKCGASSCVEFAEAVLSKQYPPEKCQELDGKFREVLSAIVDLPKDPIPYDLMMEQTPCELIEINGSNGPGPLLVTCNFKETVRILREILEQTRTSAFLLPTFTHGYSVDNAVHERMFKAVEIWKAIKENHVEDRLARPSLVIPGLAESERNAIKQLTRWDVSVGPLSGFLIPLFVLTQD